jgi:hypothetical protein
MGEIFDHDETMTNLIEKKTPTERGNGGTKRLDQMSNQKTLVKSRNKPMRVVKESRGPFKRGTKLQPRT